MKKTVLVAIFIAVLLLAGCVREPSEPIIIEVPTPVPATLPPSESPAVPTLDLVPKASPAADGIYTIAWISDTQFISESEPEVFYKMTQYLKDNREAINLQYIIHTGDLVDNYDQQEQWDAAVGAMKIIEDIPHGVLAGNHDLETKTENYDPFYKYFGADKYRDKPYYGGSYSNNRGHYDLLDIGSVKFIFVYMGFSYSTAGSVWMNNVLAEYEDRIAILCFHNYLRTDGELTDNGKVFFDEVVAKNANVYMVLCGHMHNVKTVTAEVTTDGKKRTVYQLISNYQLYEGGTTGYLRLITIDDKNKTLHFQSYSPHLDDYTYFDDENKREQDYASVPEMEDFTIPFPWG